jgi:hypothetical protein
MPDSEWRLIPWRIWAILCAVTCANRVGSILGGTTLFESGRRTPVCELLHKAWQMPTRRVVIWGLFGEQLNVNGRIRCGTGALRVPLDFHSDISEHLPGNHPSYG